MFRALPDRRITLSIVSFSPIILGLHFKMSLANVTGLALIQNIYIMMV